MIKTADFVRELSLEVLSPSSREEMDIHSAELNRPGLQFVGYYRHFPHDWPQVVGLTEMSYLEPDDINGYGYLEAIRDVFLKGE